MAGNIFRGRPRGGGLARVGGRALLKRGARPRGGRARGQGRATATAAGAGSGEAISGRGPGYRPAERVMATGRVSTQATAMFRTVLNWRPDRPAAIVPATPEERTWVVLTGSPPASA